jgi:enolase-phosphatase E1
VAGERLPVVLTDIEGTTGSIRFVHDVLFPYSRERMGAFLTAHCDEPAVRAEIQAVAREAGVPPDDLSAVTATLIRWIDEDRKATPLKALQGMIWKDGFESGELVAHIYPDAAARLRAWHAAGHPIHVYSSGSIAAQKLYFAHTGEGDLTPILSGHFDTTTGGKREADSYRAIAARIGVDPADIVFLSDVEAELEAAEQAGLRTVWLTRDGRPEGATRPSVASFDEITL